MGGFHVPSGAGRPGYEFLTWGVGPLNFKLSASDTDGELLVGEIIGSGFGVPRHLHYEQDEWFYITKGTFLIEVGGEQFNAKEGDSLYGPRMVPHAWAPVGDGPNTMIFTLQPAGPFEEFAQATHKLGRLPTPEEANAIFEASGMKITGPPLDAAKTSFEGA